MQKFSADPKKALQALKQNSSVQEALVYVKEHLNDTIRDQKELTLIEAPTGHEKEKAKRYLEMLREAGLEEVYMDKHFNVIGKIKGSGDTGCGILLEGHLDTVFSFGDVKGIEVDEKGRIHCPGICDDTRALAANLSVLRAFKSVGLKPVHDVYFCGTVREEGLGGMMGMAWTLDQLKDKTNLLATISIDGPTADVFYANATGMTDWEFIIEGPGGHAWTANDRVSALHAAAFAIAKIAKIVPPKEPKTTLTVSLIEGGQAIHAIAQKAVFKVNARSNSQKALEEVDRRICEAVEKGVEKEQKKTGAVGELKLTINKILDIPAGTQPDDAPIIQLTKLVTQDVVGNYKFLPGGCTNTNMSIERGIPAVTLGRGGEEFGTHTLAEWFNPDGVYVCEQKSILLLSLLAGLEGILEPMAKP